MQRSSGDDLAVPISRLTSPSSQAQSPSRVAPCARSRTSIYVRITGSSLMPPRATCNIIRVGLQVPGRVFKHRVVEQCPQLMNIIAGAHVYLRWSRPSAASAREACTKQVSLHATDAKPHEFCDNILHFVRFLAYFSRSIVKIQSCRSLPGKCAHL